MENESQINTAEPFTLTKTENDQNNVLNPNDSNKVHLLQCKYCPKKYKVLGTLKKHEEWCPQKKNALTQEKQEETAEIQEGKINACKECGQTFKYAKILQKHEAMHKSNSPYWCKLCMENFPSYEEKVVHKMNKHPTKDKKRKCRICPNIIFNSEEEHLYHITEVHKGKYEDYYMCSDCGKQFKTKSELTHHNNSKCGTIKQYKCKVCGQDLMTAGSLHNHMLRHTGERCCMCGYCGKMFLTTGQLKVHERTHTQEKAFVCNVCGKGFCHRQSLITHSTLHTGIKPYQCDNCGQSFSCVGNLIKHRRTHADTCGATPLTTHRVNNPSTKMKVKINTPKNSKLKMMRKEQELQEKLAVYKEKLSRRSSTENEANQSNNSTNDKFLLSSRSSDCSLQDKTAVGEDLPPYDFKVKNETVNEVPYVPQGFLQKNGFELDATEFNKTYVNNSTDQAATNDKRSNGCELSFFKIRNEQQEYSVHDEKFLNNSNTELEPGLEIEISLPTVGINNTVAFEDINRTKNSQTEAFEERKGYLCEAEDLDENFESTDGYYAEEHHTDGYDSEFCEDVEIEQEIRLFESKPNKSPVKVAKKNRKSKQEKVTETEVEEFIKQRGFNGVSEGNCQYCKKVYTNLRWLFRHEKEHEKKLNQNQNKSRLPYRCSCCKVGFETREECKAHQQNMHADILTCQDCDKLFSNVDSLRSHQNIFHKGLPRKVYVYVCEKCGLQFRQKASLVHHEKSNCGAGPIYECHVCGKGFNSMHTRRSHLRIHDPKKRFLCKFCGKSFRWKGQLKIHERSHTGEKPFECLYCPKAFAYRESLVTHSSLHTGIKPHLCQACGSRFSCIGNLIKHRGTHASTCGIWYSKNQ